MSEGELQGRREGERGRGRVREGGEQIWRRGEGGEGE